jgi:hypothetical protein
MKKKSLFLTAVTTLSLATATMAQVPNYVPTNGLVGWWPFNGNANDESGVGNNGTVNGATLTSDRFGNSNTAYSFDGVNDFISISDNNSLDFTTTYTISVWVQIPDYSTPQFLDGIGGSTDAVRTILGKPRSSGWTTGYSINSVYELYQGLSNNFTHSINDGTSQSIVASSFPLPLNSWINIIAVKTPTNISLYRNGVLEQTINTTLTLTNSSEPLYIGKEFTNTAPIDWYRWFKGKADDIGIWNRALTQQEVTNLYNGCQLSVNTQPTNQTINVNNNAQFVVSSSDLGATFQWQTDLGVGYQNLNSVGQYSGTTNDTLIVSNVTMSNNNQPLRCIISSGSCMDTSDVAVLTVNNNVGINETLQDNLFTVFPNPAQNIINVKVDSKLIGSIYTIYDNTGRVVLSGIINSVNTTIELGNITEGIYMFSVGENMKQNFKIIKE